MLVQIVWNTIVQVLREQIEGFERGVSGGEGVVTAWVMLTAQRSLLALAALLAFVGAVCLITVSLGRAGALPASDLELVVGSVHRPNVGLRRAFRVVPGQQLVGGTETYPYWERENTGDPEAFADDYIDECIRNLYPEPGHLVSEAKPSGCPGAWDSRVWSPIRDTYDEDHPELNVWPPP